jgi:hypothetical protein
MCLTEICCSSKSTRDFEPIFGYVARYVMSRLCTKNYKKLLSKSFNMIYFVFKLNMTK